MSALTFAPHAPVHAGLSYTQNVGRAARALIAALLAVPVRKDAAIEVASAPSRRLRDIALSSAYDSMMPNLAQELSMMARRD